MDINFILAILDNAYRLILLGFLYEISYLISDRYRRFLPYITGLLAGLAGLTIMTEYYRVAAGIVYDTRTILISLTALVFGVVPSVIASVITVIFRIYMGGIGVIPGVLSILVANGIGLLWRRLKPKSGYSLLNHYLFGISVHVGMLVCWLVMPSFIYLPVLRVISLPVLVVYPVVSVVFSTLLHYQKRWHDSLTLAAEAEERYHILFANNHTVMMLIDPDDGQIVEANPAACDFYGYPAKTMKTMKITQINTLPLEEVQSIMQKAIGAERNYYLFKHRKITGETVDVEVYSGPIRLHGKTLLFSIIHDISRRVAANNALLESENRFRMLVEGSPDAIFIQVDKRFAFLNQSALALFGASSPEQLLDTPVIDRIHPGYYDIIKSRLARLSLMNIPAPPLEEIYIRLDGSPIYVDVSSVPVFYKNQKGAIVFARDISERKAFEAKKNEMEAQQRQQQKLEAIGTLAGGVAHEINNPLNGIMNYAQLILDDLEKDSPLSEYAAEILHETQRISEIVKNLLQFSRQEKQSHSYASIYDIVNQTISLIKTIIKSDQIALHLDMEEDLPDIKCRSQQIQQVLMNLLTNARDAVNEKYPDFNEDKVINLRVRQYAENGRKWLKIIVEDHGNGIPPELHEKIFEPFFSTKPKEKGTGLGLSISFGIIKDHHGKISLKTKKGRYTNFIVDLPVNNNWEL